MVRRERKLKQREVALELGVSEWSVINWEKSRTFPPLDLYPKVTVFLGRSPILDPPGRTVLETKLKRWRRALGLTFEEYGRRSGISQWSLQGWEAGETVPRRESLERLEEYLTKAAGTTVRLDEPGVARSSRQPEHAVAPL